MLKCSKCIKKGELRIIWKEKKLHSVCFSQINSRNSPSCGLDQFYDAVDMKGFDKLSLNQQKMLQTACDKFHSQFITMRLSKHKRFDLSRDKKRAKDVYDVQLILD